MLVSVTPTETVYALLRSLQPRVICSVVEAPGPSVPLGQLPGAGCPLRVKCMLTGSAPHCHVAALAPVFVTVCVAAQVPLLPPLVEICVSWSEAGLSASDGGGAVGLVGLAVGVLEGGPPGLPPAPPPEPPGVLPLDGVEVTPLPEVGVPEAIVLLPPDGVPPDTPVGSEVEPELVVPLPWLPPDVLVGEVLPLVAVCPVGSLPSAPRPFVLPTKTPGIGVPSARWAMSRTAISAANASPASEMLPGRKRGRKRGRSSHAGAGRAVTAAGCGGKVATALADASRGVARALDVDRAGAATAASAAIGAEGVGASRVAELGCRARAWWRSSVKARMS